MISVSTKRVCGRCFSGYIENGICNRCHTRGEEKRSFNALPQGAKLYGGRYFIGDVLGIGGFGITYAAWDSQLFTRVAIKELFPDRGFSRLSDRVTVKPDQGQEEYFKHISYRFIEESSLLLGFADQPNIVSVYNAFSENHTVYYVMEFLEGKDLQHLVIETGKLNMQRLYPIVMPILDALEVLHKNNMIHRDIKPANIFITTNGSPKLIDFGSARVCHHNNSCSRYVTDGFAPYEQYVTNGKQGPWTDIYSLCVTIYYCMSGKKPPNACERRLGTMAIPLNKLCPELPDGFVATIHKGMAVDAEHRYKSAPELKSALLKYKPDLNQKSRWKMVFTGGQINGQTFSLPENCNILLGRSPNCTVRLQCSAVSAKHLTVYISKGGKIYVRDEASRNGSLLECMKLNSGVWYTIQPGQKIKLAETEEFTIVRG